MPPSQYHIACRSSAFVASWSAGVAERCHGVERGIVYVPLVDADGPPLHDVEGVALVPLVYDGGHDQGLTGSKDLDQLVELLGGARLEQDFARGGRG